MLVADTTQQLATPTLGDGTQDSLAALYHLKTVYRIGWGETVHSHNVENIEAPTFEALFAKISVKPSSVHKVGPYVCAPMQSGIRNKANSRPTNLLLLDFDHLTAVEGVSLCGAVESLGVSAISWTTASSKPENPKLRLMVELSSHVERDHYAVVCDAFITELKCVAGCDLKIDPRSRQPEQPMFVPLAGSTIKKFVGPDKAAYDIATAVPTHAAKPPASKPGIATAQQESGKLPNDPVVVAAQENGLHPEWIKPGTVGLQCPWKHEHTSESSNSSSALLLPHYEGREGYGYRCLHAHCAHRGIKDLREFLGLSESLVTELKLSLKPISGEWLDVPLPPTEFVLDGWLPRSTVGLLVAEGGTGKTMLALRLAMAVAGGRDLFGIPTRQGKAVLLGLEDPEDVLRRRTKSIYDAEAEEFDAAKGSAHLYGPSYVTYGNNLRQRFICRSLVGSELHLVRTGSGGVEQGEWIERLTDALKDVGQVELLVLDPLSRLHGLEENDSSVGTALINAAERIAQEIGCAVLITHHTGKDNSRKRATDSYAARGTSALADGARTVLRLVPAEENAGSLYSDITEDDIENGLILNLVHAKSNYGPRQAKLWLRKDEAGISLFVPVPKNAFLGRWAAFADWWKQHMSPKPVYKDSLVQRRGEIWGKLMTTGQVTAFMQQAIDEDLLQPTNAKAKNPNAKAWMPVLST